MQAESDPELYRLIAAFERRTGVPMILNPAFIENEPSVTTPEAALDCFSSTTLDALALEEFLVRR